MKTTIIKAALCFLFVGLANLEIMAATITSTKTGNWGTAGTWDSGTVPTATDDVVIASGHTVTVTGAQLTSVNLTVAGILTYATNSTVGGLIVKGTLTISSGGVFNAHNGNVNKLLTLGGDFVNNGTFEMSYNTTHNGLYFNGTNPSNISGTGTFGAVRILTIDNPAGVTIATGTSLNISSKLLLLNGALTNNGTLTLDNMVTGTSGLASSNIEIRRTQVASLVNPYTVGANAVINLNYIANSGFAASQIIAGDEIPTSRNIYTLTINNPQGVLFSDDITSLSSATSALTLTSGVLTVASGKTLAFSNALFLGVAGSSSSYVDGAVSLGISETVAQTKTFPIGSGEQYRSVILSDVKATVGNSAIRFAIEAASGGTLGANIATLSSTRRFVGTVNGSLDSYTSIGIGFGNDDGNPLDKIAVSSTSGGVYDGLGTTIGANTSSMINSATGTYTSLGYFALGTQGSSLPVTLTSYTAKVLGNRVQVKWTTQSEQNNDYFIVEKSTDGTHFSTLAKVVGHGTSTVENNYSAYDNNPVSGDNYYRLVQYDLDGITKDYGTKAVDFKLDAAAGISIYPNPISDKINIVFTANNNASVLLQLSNMAGERVYHKKITQIDAQNPNVINLKDLNLVSGIYILTVSDNNSTKNFKLIKK